MPSLVILGASGFLGRSIISLENFSMPIKAIARRIPEDADIDQKGVAWIAVDLMNKNSLTKILNPGDVVINLVYISGDSKAKNIFYIDNLIEACLESNIARLVHCSTAVVAGATRSLNVVESTISQPITHYEKIKWELEQRVLTVVPKGLDLVILRPTAILGPGGKNLLKLAESLQSGNRLKNYLRASVFGKRHMHLVPVRNVAAALLHIATLPGDLRGEVYNISSDDDPNNNFQSVEEILLQSLGLKHRKIPLLPMPECLLSLFLRLLGKSDTNIKRIYDSSKLMDTNFKPIDSVVKAIVDFSDAYSKNKKMC